MTLDPASPITSTPTPHDTQPDWLSIKTLYLQGTPLAEISRSHGVSIHVIRNRAWRAGWRNESLADCSEQPASVQALVKEWFGNMAISLLSRSQWWANNELQPADFKETKDMENALASHISSGRMLFGLDKDNGSNSPSWGRASNASGPVIDVTPVPLKPAG